MCNDLKLNNYLLKLVDKSDTVGNSLYLYNVENIIKQAWKEIIDKKKKIGVRKIVPEKLKLEPTHLYAIIKGKRGISIQSLYQLLNLWKEYCIKTSEDVNQIWNEIYNSFIIASFSKAEKITLPKYLTPNLCYLIGCIIGDGCFDASGNHYRLKISEQNMEHLENVLKPMITNIFNVNCLIKNEGSGRDKSNFLILNSKPIFRFFRNVLNVKVGEIPEIIKKTNLINKTFFIRGVFDAEGSVDAKYIRGRIRFFQKSKYFLENIIDLLKELNISINGPYGPHLKQPSEKFHYFSSWHSIEIRKKSEVLKFIEVVGSNHPEKTQKMKILAKEIKNKYKYTSSK